MIEKQRGLSKSPTVTLRCRTRVWTDASTTFGRGEDAHEPHGPSSADRYSTEGLFVEFGQSPTGSQGLHAREGGEHSGRPRSVANDARSGEVPARSWQLVDGAKDGDPSGARRVEARALVDRCRPAVMGFGFVSTSDLDQNR